MRQAGVILRANGVFLDDNQERPADPGALQVSHARNARSAPRPREGLTSRMPLIGRPDLAARS